MPRSRCWALFAALLLSACTQAPLRPPAVPVSVGEAFALNGRIAVLHRGERSSVNVRWAHQPAGDDILLLAPLGLTVAHLQRDPAGVTLEARGQQYQEQNSEDLMDRVVGWHLPLDELHDWVRARPYPATPFSAVRNPQQQLTELQQDGWTVRYSRYPDAGAASLPQRLWFRHDDMELTLLIDEWEALPPLEK